MGLKIKILLTLVLAALTLPSGYALADVYSSTNYQFNESQVGGAGSGLQSSTNYQAFQNAGDLTVGNYTGTNYQIEGGFNTTTQPFLEVFVTSGNLSLGTLSTASAATTTTTFYVRAYLASGYVVRTQGTPPASGNVHTFTALSSPTASSVGTEQFGMNLVANTSPVTFGANPSQVPDSTFGFGTAASGYNTANLYKYNQGDTIASSAKSSGETLFTISYLENISNNTPGGTYTYNQDLVVTATY